jgi:hypothetical protein
MNAKDKIEELALKVAMEALGPGVPLEARMEALKILNPHYTMLLKSKAKEEPTATGGFDFDAFNLETEHVNAGTTVGGDSGRGIPPGGLKHSSN